jgi:two-component system response regulator MprA
MDQNTILVIDDDADIRDSLSDALGDEGYVVRLASNGKEAMDLLLRLNRPRGIILDIAMPVMNGSEFYRAMRAVPALADIPIVVSTSNPSSAPSGVPVMKKPVDLERLLSMVARFSAAGPGSIDEV